MKMKIKLNKTKKRRRKKTFLMFLIMIIDDFHLCFAYLLKLV